MTLRRDDLKGATDGPITHTIFLSLGGRTFLAEDHETVPAAALRVGLVISYSISTSLVS